MSIRTEVVSVLAVVAEIFYANDGRSAGAVQDKHVNLRRRFWSQIYLQNSKTEHANNGSFDFPF